MTEIFGTLGPACSGQNVLERMFEAGLTGMRLNLSHTSLEKSAPLIDAFHAAAANCGVSPALLIDMQGPELRVGKLERELVLSAGDKIRFGRGGIPVPDAVLPELTEGREVLLDDGKLLVRIKNARGGYAEGFVLRGGTLQSAKSVAVRGVSIHTPAMTEADLKNFAAAKKAGVTAVMQPFVRSKEDLHAVRAALDGFGCGDVQLFSKIESLEGLGALPEIMAASDVIIIARGDLGNATGLTRLPGVQKDIAASCRAAGKPFLVATQMLASMEHSPVPTRAEISDVFNAVLDGAHAVMLTAETAVGRYPVESIRYLKDTAAAAEKWMAERPRRDAAEACKNGAAY